MFKKHSKSNTGLFIRINHIRTLGFEESIVAYSMTSLFLAFFFLKLENINLLMHTVFNCLLSEDIVLKDSVRNNILKFKNLKNN